MIIAQTDNDDEDIVKRAIIMVEDKENLLTSISFIERKFVLGNKGYSKLRNAFVELLSYSNGDGIIDYDRLYENRNNLSSYPLRLFLHNNEVISYVCWFYNKKYRRGYI